MQNPEVLILRIPAILLALTVHEYAHGLVALWRGDTTARDQGRLTLNPLAHLDIFGTMMMFFGPFGWAKPVPVNPGYMRNPRKDMILVGAAGPVSNIILACITGLLMRFFITSGIPALSNMYLLLFMQIFFMLNLGLSFFNLIPIPPLDGSQILMSFLPPNKSMAYLNAIRYAPMIFIGLLAIEWALHIPVFSAIMDPIWNPYFNFFQVLIFGHRIM